MLRPSSFAEAQRDLAILWMVGASGISLLALIRTVQGYYEQPDVLWNWLLPTILPTVTLIVASRVASTTGARRRVDLFSFRTAFGASAFYLLVVFSVLLLAASPLLGVAPSSLQNRTGAFLAAMQGIVSAAIGRYFAKSND